MKMRAAVYYIIFVVLFLWGETSLAQLQNDSIFQKNTIASFQFKDPVTGKSIRLKDQDLSTQLVAYLFISPECPLCQNYMPLLNKLQVKYKDSMKLIGIVPGKAYTTTDINQFKKKYKTDFPLYIDTKKQFTTYLQASITPEVIVLNNEGRLIYKGAIDDRLNKLGERRVNVSENYFADAIDQYKKDKVVVVKRRKAIGCTINDF